jgi:hypothetical protein
VYTAKDPFVLGVGAAAMRDVNSFFRYSARDDAGTANPVAGKINFVIGFGNSQSGRFQKHFLNNGFNEDENGKIVWDGMNPNIAGMMGSFNIRSRATSPSSTIRARTARCGGPTTKTPCAAARPGACCIAAT